MWLIFNTNALIGYLYNKSDDQTTPSHPANIRAL